MKMYREDKIFQVVAHVFMGTVTVITVPAPDSFVYCILY